MSMKIWTTFLLSIVPKCACKFSSNMRTLLSVECHWLLYCEVSPSLSTWNRLELVRENLKVGSRPAVREHAYVVRTRVSEIHIMFVLNHLTTNARVEYYKLHANRLRTCPNVTIQCMFLRCTDPPLYHVICNMSEKHVMSLHLFLVDK